MVLKRLPVTRRRRFSHEAETGQLRYARARYGGRAERASVTNVRYRRGSIDGPLPRGNPTPDVTTKRTSATHDRRARHTRAFGSIVDRHIGSGGGTECIRLEKQVFRVFTRRYRYFFFNFERLVNK